MVITIIIIAVALVIIFALVRGNKSHDQIKSSEAVVKKSPKFNDNMTVDEMVSAITELKDLKSLERKSESLSEKHFNTNDKKYNTLSQKYYKAFEIGSKLVFKYQFVPNDEINTPLAILQDSFKVVNKMDELFHGIKDITKYGYWEEFDGDILLQNPVKDLVEAKPDYWNGVIKFREILESVEVKETKVELLKNLIKTNKSFRDNYVSNDTEEIDDFIEQYLK